LSSPVNENHAAVIVQLNNIFQNSGPDIMEGRMDHAFGINGKDFWKNFFPCEDLHPNLMVIYLFTEHQLKRLREWLTVKLDISDIKLREIAEKHLKYSRQTFFRDAIMTQKKSWYRESRRACYIKPDNTVKRVYFIPPECKLADKVDINFFDPGTEFGGEPLLVGPAVEGKDLTRKKLVAILTARHKIAKPFDHGPERNTSWLYYLNTPGYRHNEIKYCTDANLELEEKRSVICPLIPLVHGRLTERQTASLSKTTTNADEKKDS